jgi:hypothetical protein
MKRPTKAALRRGDTPATRQKPSVGLASSGLLLACAAAFLGAAIAACEPGETGSTSAGGGGGDGGSGGQPFCSQGETMPCYTGPVVTENVGPCKGGQRTCNAEGTAFGVCTGEVTPLDDDCATPADEDCDGTPAPACPGAVTAGVRFGGAGDDVGRDVAIDSAGATILVGSFEGSAELGGGEVMSMGGKDIFVIKHDAAGKHVFSKAFGDMADQSAASVAVATDGSFVVTGSFAGAVDFGAGPLLSAGGKDIFAVKLNAAGGVVWSKAFGGLGLIEEGVSAAIDGSGDVVLAGVFDGSFTAGATVLTTAGGLDVFVMKLAGGTGDPMWASRYGDASAQVARSVAIGSADVVYVGGNFKGSVDFGGGPVANAGGEDAFLLKLNSGGFYVTSVGYGGALDDSIQGVAADPAGGVVVVGRFGETIDFGGGALTSAGAEDIFLAKLNDANEHLFSKSFGDASSQIVESVAVGADSSIVVTGRFMGSLDLGHKPPLPSTEVFDIFVAKLDPLGAYVWGDVIGGPFDQSALSIAIDASGASAITGMYYGTLGVGEMPLMTAGLSDLFLVKFAP